LQHEHHLDTPAQRPWEQRAPEHADPEPCPVCPLVRASIPDRQQGHAAPGSLYEREQLLDCRRGHVGAGDGQRDLQLLQCSLGVSERGGADELEVLAPLEVGEKAFGLARGFPHDEQLAERPFAGFLRSLFMAGHQNPAAAAPPTRPASRRSIFRAKAWRYARAIPLALRRPYGRSLV